jgi:hypothetical protein
VRGAHQSETRQPPAQANLTAAKAAACPPTPTIRRPRLTCKTERTHLRKSRSTEISPKTERPASGIRSHARNHPPQPPQTSSCGSPSSSPHQLPHPKPAMPPRTESRRPPRSRIHCEQILARRTLIRCRPRTSERPPETTTLRTWAPALSAGGVAPSRDVKVGGCSNELLFPAHRRRLVPHGT